MLCPTERSLGTLAVYFTELRICWCYACEKADMFQELGVGRTILHQQYSVSLAASIKLIWLVYCRDEIQELYVQIQGLMDFVEVNRTGFRKALKKHDKVLRPHAVSKLP